MAVSMEILRGHLGFICVSMEILQGETLLGLSVACHYKAYAGSTSGCLDVVHLAWCGFHHLQILTWVVSKTWLHP